MQQVERYRYGVWDTLWLAGIPSILALSTLAIIPRAIGAVGRIVTGLLGGKTPLVDDLWLLVGTLIGILVSGTLLSLYTEVIVVEKGIKARVFLFFWVFIPWEDVLGLAVLPPALAAQDPYRWRLVQVKRLTFFHRLASQAYLTGPDPVLIITKKIKGYEQLVETIEAHLAQDGPAQDRDDD
jgi:hypothetical protein